MASSRSVALKSAPLSFADARFAPLSQAPLRRSVTSPASLGRLGPSRARFSRASRNSALLSFAFINLAPSRFAPISSAQRRSALVKSAPARSAPLNWAPARSRPLSEASFRFALQRFARPARCACADFGGPRKSSLSAPSIHVFVQLACAFKIRRNSVGGGVQGSRLVQGSGCCAHAVAATSRLRDVSARICKSFMGRASAHSLAQASCTREARRRNRNPQEIAREDRRFGMNAPPRPSGERRRRYATPTLGYTSRRLNPVLAVLRSMVIAR
jgi:hypothetical protein